MNSYNEKKNTYVRKQLLDTLLKMLKTQDLDSIVINDLVNEAGVSRVSFYRNYADKKDILIQEERRLFDEWHSDYDSRNTNNDLDFNQELLNFYKDHSEFYLTLFNAGMADIIMNTIIASANISDSDPNILAYFKSSVAYVIYGWVHEWMKRGMQESGSELTQMMKQMQNNK